VPCKGYMLKTLLAVVWDTIVRLGVVIGLLGALLGILAGTSDINVFTAVTVLSDPTVIVEDVLREISVNIELDPAIVEAAERYLEGR